MDSKIEETVGEMPKTPIGSQTEEKYKENLKRFQTSKKRANKQSKIG